MKNSEQIIDCVEFKNELHRKLFIKSGAKDFNEYIKYINEIYSINKQPEDVRCPKPQAGSTFVAATTTQ